MWGCEGGGGGGRCSGVGGGGDGMGGPFFFSPQDNNVTGERPGRSGSGAGHASSEVRTWAVSIIAAVLMGAFIAQVL